MVNYGEYQIPLLIGKKSIKDGHIHITVDRYAGVAFFIGTEGKIATCKHIIEMVQPDEVLLGKNLITGKIDVISNIKTHPKFDFALGNYLAHKNYKCFPITKCDYLPGHDIRAFGFTNNGKVNGTVNVNARLLKGYIISSYEKSEHPLAKTTTELSFPSLKGFSGSPIVSLENGSLVGMLFSNHESSIEVHSFMDVDDNGDKLSESIYRIIELGLAHSYKDILDFIKDIESAS